MAIGQTLADILGGLVAINKGDPGGAQAFTGQGRQQLASQRENQQMQTSQLHGVLQRAQSDPQYNAQLQQALEPFLRNEQTRAVTKHTQTQVPQIQAQTTGQQLQNAGAAQNLESFAPYGGQQAAEFGLQQASTNANVHHTEAATSLLGAQTQGQEYSLLQQRALDMMAQTYGYENHQHMQDTIKQNLAQQEMAMKLKENQQSSAATMFGHLFPNPSGTPSAAQRQMAGAAGVPLSEDPGDVQKRQMAAEAMKAVQELQGSKGKKKKGGQTPNQTTRGQGNFAGLIGPALPPQQQAVVPPSQGAQSAGQWLDQNLWPQAEGQQQGPTGIAQVLDWLVNHIAPKGTDTPYAQPRLGLPEVQKMLQQMQGQE